MAKREDVNNYNQLFGNNNANTDSTYSGVLGRNLNPQEQQVVSNYVDEVKGGTTIAQLKNEVLYRGNQKILPIVLDEVKKQIPGFNINNSDLYQSAQASTVRNLNSEQTQNRVNSINNIIHTLDDVVAPLSDKFQRTGITAINDKYLKAAYGVSNQDAVQFSSAMKGVTEELARAFGGSQGVTDAKLDFAGKLLDQNLSPAAFKAQVNTIRYLLNLNLNAIYNRNAVTIPGLPPGYSSYSTGGSYNPYGSSSPSGTSLDLSKFDH